MMFKKEKKDTDQKKDPQTASKEGKDAKITLSKKEYEELKQRAEEKDQLWDKFLRLHAEYQNSRKLWDKNKSDLLKFGNFRILKEFVTILDEIEAALVNLETHQDEKNHSEGLKMIYKKIKDVLIKEGLKDIQAQGKQFDPHLHEALFFEEREDLDEHTVIEVIQKGYCYEDKVLRPAKVKVSIRPKETQDSKLKTQDEEEAQKEEEKEGNKE